MLDGLKYVAFASKKRLLWPLRVAFPSLVNAVDDPRKTAMRCVHCRRFVRGQQYHLGFSDLLVLYCSGCEGALLMRGTVAYGDLLPPSDHLPQGDHENWQLPYWRAVESLFLPCPCGGSFGYLNPPRCPYCRAPVAGDIFEGKVVLKQREGYCFLAGEQFDARDMLRPEQWSRRRVG
jgi:hypothetical protein